MSNTQKIISNVNYIPYLVFGNDIDNFPPEPECRFYYFYLLPQNDYTVKVYLQLKPVSDLPNAPKRADGRKSAFNRKEGYADYQRGKFYADPYQLTVKK